MILSRQEVTELSGYRKPSCQISWLKRQGLRFFVSAHEPAGAPFLGEPKMPRMQPQLPMPPP